MKLQTALVALLIASPCFAETLGFALPAALSIDAEQEVLIEQSDLRISSRRIDAVYGVKREHASEYEPSAPVVLGARYLVRDANGFEHQLRVRNVIDGRMWVDLNRANSKETTRRAVVPGNYRVSEYSVDGVTASVAFSDLVINEDGTFRFGGATGRFHQVQQGLNLEGHYAEWGSGEIGEDGNTVVFDFRRGDAEVEVRFERVKSGGSSLAASR